MDFPITCTTGYRYGFGGHEKNDEVSGSGNNVDMGDRWLDTRLGRTSKPDAKSKQYPSVSPYAYALNNPIFYIDPDGKTVYVYGKDAQDATCELQKTTSLQLSYDSKKNQLTAMGKPQNDYDRALMQAILDPNVKVGLYTTSAQGYTSKDNTGPYPILIGGYEGSEVKEKSSSKEQFLADYASGNLQKVSEGTYKEYEVETTQLFNLEQAKAVENAGGEQSGRAAGHEILESFFGGVNAPGGDYNSSYKAAHNAALKVDPIAAGNKDENAIKTDAATNTKEYGWSVKGKFVKFSTKTDVEKNQFKK